MTESEQNQGNQTPPPVDEQPKFQQEQQSYQQTYNYNNQPSGNQQFYNDTDPNKPKNYLVMSIISTVLGFITCSGCCIGLILGIVAIVFSNQVDSKYNSGDINGAKSSSQTAMILGIISLALTALSLIGSVIYFVTLMSAGGLDAFMSEYSKALEQMQ